MDVRYAPAKVVYDVDEGGIDHLGSILDRVSLLDKLYEADPFESSIVVVVHGDAIPLFGMRDFAKHCELMERAQSLTMSGMIEFRMCRAAAGARGQVSVPMIAFFVLAAAPCLLAYLKFGAVRNSLAESSRARVVANRLLATLTAASATLLLVPVQPAATEPTDGGAAQSAVVRHFTGIGVARSTGTAVTEFCGEPSISRSA